VDYRRGKILLPSQIGEMAARRQIKVVRDALSLAEAAFSADSLDEMSRRSMPWLVVFGMSGSPSLMT